MTTLLRDAELAELNRLEQRFDCAIPQYLRDVAVHGTALYTAWLTAGAQVTYFRGLIRGQLLTIRERHQDGSFYPLLLADLRFYLRQWRKWRREEKRILSEMQREVEERAARTAA